MLKLKDLLNETRLNEVNARLNKKVKSFLDAYLKGTPTSSPEFHHTVMIVLKGALTDANFHSAAKKLDSMFPKAKKSEYYDNSNMIDVMEDKGRDISKWAKWDGHDILDAFSFFTNMTIGGGFGKKLETLKESISESVVVEANDDTYFKTAGQAVEFAKAQAEKKGFTIDEDDWNNQITHGGRYSRLRPSVGKTHSFIIGLLKNDKPQRKGLSISLFGMDSGNYELTYYIN